MNKDSPTEEDRYLSAARNELVALRSAGLWIPLAATALAFLLWIAIAALAVGVLGSSAIARLDPLVLTGAIAVSLAPGFALVLAGFMARETVKANRAHRLILAASQSLLFPASASTDRIERLGHRVRVETEAIEKQIASAAKSLGSFRATAEAERKSLTEVLEGNAKLVAEMSRTSFRRTPRPRRADGSHRCPICCTE